ncbi:MAG: hypothetical protein ACD_80C00147G0010 [uncultured bacterium (gcode 4)]|uniref:Uncharacterized protein n=1 Tax=uncultured bacterium (gcode 4) TaxID=1234023 RepID=K1XHV4_9BACT|nr:MAG: hypothetical protein ACD_80C00147G0010 [uncultured bacterium (gcode 4)]
MSLSRLDSSVKFWQYVAVPSLEYARNLHAALDALSFSCSPIGKDKSQSVSLQYTEWSSVYTLGWYTLYYGIHSVIISHFATANLRWLNPVLKTNTYFASKMHLLRKPVPWLWSKLFEHAIDMAMQHNVSCIKISSDASSVPFYIKMSEKFSDCFVSVDEHHRIYNDGWCDFVFRLK